MKKIIILSVLMGLFTLNTGNVVLANEFTESEIMTRTEREQQYTFSNYLPKKYRGLTLWKVRKTTNGYVGTYL